MYHVNAKLAKMSITEKKLCDSIFLDTVGPEGRKMVKFAIKVHLVSDF